MNPGVSTDATARMARVQWAHGAHRLNSVKPETNSKATKHRFCCFSSGCWIAVYHIFLQNSPMPACRVPSKKHTIFTPCIAQRKNNSWSAKLLKNCESHIDASHSRQGLENPFLQEGFAGLNIYASPPSGHRAQ